MPIYEYRCGQGHQFEVMQRMTDDPVIACETCSAPVQRVFHPVAVHFKGSGFYSTDYGSRNRARELKESGEGKGKHAKDEGSAKSDSAKSDSAKSDSDSKPSKSESKTTSSSTTPSTSSD